MNTPWSIALGLFLTFSVAIKGQGVVINELRSSGEGPDVVELLNTGDRPIELSGIRFNLKERTAQLAKQTTLARSARCVIAFGNNLPDSVLHIPFGLPKDGGTLLLVSLDGLKILDVCTWPSMPSNVSIGRQPDGGKGWSFFAEPSFGVANADTPTLRRIAAMPWAEGSTGLETPQERIILRAEQGDHIRYTNDGTEPTAEHGTDYSAPITINRNTVIKARAFGEGALPSNTFTGTFLTHGPNGTTVAVNMLPDDAWDGGSTSATVELCGFGNAGARTVQLRESGSGSRSYPKRNLKVDAHGKGTLPWPDGTMGEEAILRADATPHAFLHNLFMEVVARQSGGHVDVQVSLPMELYLNGNYHGLYRWMPPKDEEWLCATHGYEALDILHGPSLRKIEGDRSHFHAAYEALLSGEPLDTLAASIDMSSLIDLACFDLWSGRADHDLNVRCWRPKEAGGKWRWVLYDMDLWAPVDDNSLARMCGEAVPVAPYLPQLLHRDGTRDALLARMTALVATILEPANGRAIVDSLYTAHAEALARDHDRWSAEMQIPEPSLMRSDLLDFTTHRSAHVLHQLSVRTGLKLRTMEITATPGAGGTVEVEDLRSPPLPLRFGAFAGVPLRIRAVPAVGYSFVGWKQHEGGEVITIDPRKSHKLTAVFKRTASDDGPSSDESGQHGLQQAGENGLAIGVP